MDKIKLRALVFATVLSLLALVPMTVNAQSPLQATQILIGAPAQANLGTPVTVQAVLADSQGHPISKAVIYFTTQTTFLESTSDVVLAQAMTNGQGQASAQITDDFSGNITVHAEFRGDTQYAPADATAQISAADDQQVYIQHVGVDIPGFNVPPVGAPQASIQSQQGIVGFIQDLWPTMNGWPVAAVLLLVWSMYFFAVTFVFRVAKMGNESGDSSAEDPRRSL